MNREADPNPATTPLHALEDHGEFIMRHIGPRDDQVERMLSEIGMASLDELIQRTIPRSIRLEEPLDLPEAKTEKWNIE